jgi:Na+-translocating ferredoxin:NAD+ oxidoreductase RnfG subunit
MKRPQGWWLAGLALTAPAAYVAHAETYLTEEKAVAVMFPGIKMTPRWIDLTDSQRKAIEKASGEKVREKRVRAWWGPKGQAVFIDQVIGKHEFITYAVGVASNGTVKNIEIMDYRETYGYEIRRPEWRRQFIGKTLQNPLKLDEDIKNISGATLSSAHVTAGVRRVLGTYGILKYQR